MESLIETRSVRKHREIMRAATEAFIAKGYEGASMDEIATLAQVSKQTIYKHFSDKERLFEEIVLGTTDDVDDLVGLVAQALAKSHDVQVDLSHLARQLIAAITQPRLLQLRRLIIANADRLPALGRAWYENGFGRVLTTLTAAFADLARRGLLKSQDDPARAAEHFVGMLLWIPVNRAMFTGQVEPATPHELDSYADDAVRAFLRGYSPAG